MRGVEEPSFLTHDSRQAIIQLRQAFAKAQIFQHFDLEHYIRIETDASNYAIAGVFSQIMSEKG